jgi:hypothetical protein
MTLNSMRSLLLYISVTLSLLNANIVIHFYVNTHKKSVERISDWDVKMDKLPGVYLLAIHYSVGLRAWAQKIINKLGNITTDDWDTVAFVFDQCLSTQRPFLPAFLSCSCACYLHIIIAILEFELFDGSELNSSPVSVALTRSR